MKTERELFEVWCCRCDIDTSRYNLIGNQKYKDSTVEAYWEGWKASTNRQGYKLVPMEPTEEMLDAARRRQWDDLSSPLEDMDTLKYKAMLEAVN